LARRPRQAIILRLERHLQLKVHPTAEERRNQVIFAFSSAFCSTDQLALAFQAPGGGIGLVGSVLPLVLIMVIFYFLMILPAQRRQKKVSEMLKALKNGDKVITNGGIYGTIVGLEDDAVQLRIAEQVKMKVARSAIAGLQAEPPKES
jgi:preprotein translocase subunit YajC